MNLLHIALIFITISTCKAAIVSKSEEDCENCDEASVCLYKCKIKCSRSECDQYCIEECTSYIDKCKTSNCSNCMNKCWNKCTDDSCSYNCIDQCSKCESGRCTSCVNQCSNGCRNPSCNYNCINRCSSCQSNSCSSCYSQCRNGCEDTSCNHNCLNQCSNRCGSCNTNSDTNKCTETKQECKESDHVINNSTNTMKTNTSSSSISNPKVDVLTDINISNDLNVINNLSNPITVNSDNVNNITLELDISQPPIQPTNPRVLPTRYERDSCCVVVEPKNCTYNNSNQVNCTHDYSKQCSPICQSPIVMPHPVYIRVPHPVPMQVPYPVHNVKYVERPYPVYVQSYVNKPIYIPVNQPVPYPVNRIVHQPIAVPQPYPVPFQKNIYIPQPYPQPVIYNKIIPQYIQQPCPLINYGGIQTPVCKNLLDSQKFIFTRQNFFVDNFIGQNQRQVFPNCPYGQNCNQVQLQQCGGCLHCQGNFNMHSCLNSNFCPPQCRQVIGSIPSLQHNIGNILKCTTTSSGRTMCQ